MYVSTTGQLIISW